MKSSLGKLRKIAMNKSEPPKDNWDLNTSVHVDGLSQAAKDMKDMRTCYDSLLSAAAATANSAYEFSESLLEMGSCLLDKTAIHDDGESGGTLSLLGRVQLELRRLVDLYRSHIIMTITNPSESLLSELRKVEEMKLQCDEKREMFEYMVGQLKEKGKSRHGKGENFSSQQVHAVREEYDEAARLCVFRVESLKQGQCRSLLTQAARHHAAQLNFFRKGLQSLEAVEPRVKNVAETHHIDYELVELRDGQEIDDEGSSFDTNVDRELSFDFRQSKQDLENASVSRNSMELDLVGAPNPQMSRMKDSEAQVNSGKNQGEFSQQHRAGSHSAPIHSEKFDPAERIREMQNSAWKLNTHVLPTPADAKGSKTNTTTPPTSAALLLPNKSSKDLWHSSPLDTGKFKKFTDDHMSAHSTSKSPAAAEEKGDKHYLPLPRPLNEVTAVPQFDAIDSQKIKRQAFSGPLAGKPSPNKLQLFTGGPVGSTEQPQSISGMLSHVTGGPPPPPSSLNVPHSAAHPLLSSPKISELHELPRPPDSLASNPARSAVALGHSAPLGNRNRELSPTYRYPLRSSKEGSTLPLPRLSISRSFSIRTTSQATFSLHAGKGIQSSQIAQNMGEVTSPPLTPIALLNMKSPNSGQVRGGN
ncbi:hypothetical protein F511_18401 [Dorcoceras hygrometricum]|uniref:Hydroxyproline-rich glycoprotein family protein n=1 Tax=Dorcoceras hygrometricum TaxID=472368 RepID=A0A2Z7C546_9LAMI|nr:hypothetical protein F511_18401 [Dorcoceras hygrometricum]